jgi:L-ornithine N5-oxygenase
VTDQEVGVLAIGAGPANLALAVALEECGDQALAEDTLVLEQHGQLLDEMHLTNYGGLAPPFLDELDWMLYRQKVPGPQRSAVRPMTEVVGARIDGDEVVLDLRDRRSGKVEPLHCDLVLLGTGYEPRMPAMARDLADRVGMTDLMVNRCCRLDLGDSVRAAVYLQGANEQTHGIADSLLSTLAHRSQDIATDLLARRGVAATVGGA